MDGDAEQEWQERGGQYRKLIADRNESSNFLREIGLKPVLQKLLGDCTRARVLDVGAGSGWLFDLIGAAEACACDLVQPEAVPPHVMFKIADATDLPWSNGRFDVVVSNLMLCYLSDVNKALIEMARVATPSGRLVISIVHPYFYRTGIVAPNGAVTIESDLSVSRSFDISIGNKVGPFRYHYRPYPDYINALVKAGWRIHEVKDWFIEADRYRAKFPTGDSVTRSNKVPLFTFFSCGKNA